MRRSAAPRLPGRHELARRAAWGLAGAGLLVAPVGAFVAAGAAIALSRRHRGDADGLVPLAIFAAVASAATATAATPATAVLELAALLVVLAVMGVSAFLLDRAAADSLAGGFAAAGVVLAVVAGWQLGVDGVSRASATSYHPNVAAATALLALGGAVVLWVRCRAFGARLLAACGACGALAVVVASGSRSAGIALLIGAAVFALRTRGRPRRVALLALAFVLAFAAAAALLPGEPSSVATLGRFRQLADPVAAAGGRPAIWTVGLRLAAARPLLGYGPGAERALAPAAGALALAQPVPHFHSAYLRWAIEGGAALLLAAFLLFGSAARRLRRSAAGPAGAAAVATLTALLVASVFDPLLAFAPLFAAAWLLLRLAAVTVGAGQPGAAAANDRRPSVRTLSGATLRNATRTRASGPPRNEDAEEMTNA